MEKVVRHELCVVQQDLTCKQYTADFINFLQPWGSDAMSVPTASRERSARLSESARQTSSTTPAWKHLAVSPYSKGILLQVGIRWKSWVNLLRLFCPTFNRIYSFKIFPPWGPVACRRSSPTARERAGRAPAKPTSAMGPPTTQAGWHRASY